MSPGKHIRLEDYSPSVVNGLNHKKEAKAALLEDIDRLVEAQELLWASSQYSVLIIFQAMDAAGKDGTIKHVMSGINPQGCDVYSFKAPSEEEKKHHFLWRPQRFLPQKGRIAIFNRSYYEEVLVVRVHPSFLDSQWMPERLRGKELKEVWKTRYQEINEFEKRISLNDTCVIKFFLNISREEQKKRFLDRLENDRKNWKFSAADLRERAHWDDYQSAYEDMLNATSTEWAPWYVIPADKKWYMRAVVADVISSRIRKLKLRFPDVSEAQKADIKRAIKELNDER